MKVDTRMFQEVKELTDYAYGKIILHGFFPLHHDYRNCTCVGLHKNLSWITPFQLL
jgi:hypothetical protein